MHVLLVKTSSMGDLIHMYPAITAFKKAYPAAKLTWLCEQAFASIAGLHPDVDAVITVNLRQWRHSLHRASTWAAYRQVRAQLAQQSFDAVIDTQGLLKSAWLCTWVKAPSIGYDRLSIREPWASFFYDQQHHVLRSLHAVTRNMHLMAQAFGFHVSDAPNFGLAHRLALPETNAAHALIDDRFLTQPFCVFLHATSQTKKYWPLSDWIALGLHLNQPILLPWGTQDELIHAQKIAEQLPLAYVLPSVSLDYLAFILSKAHAVIGVDTGLTHLANALMRPTLALFTATDPNKTGIYESSIAKNLGTVNQAPKLDAVVASFYEITQACAV